MRRFGPTALQEPAVVELTHMMLMRDPPDHTRLRGLVAKAFTARRIEAMRARVQDLTDRLLDKVIPLGRMDAIRDLAFPLPVLVICELLGIPEPDRGAFRHRLQLRCGVAEPDAADPRRTGQRQRRHAGDRRPISTRCSSSGGGNRATI